VRSGDRELQGQDLWSLSELQSKHGGVSEHLRTVSGVPQWTVCQHLHELPDVCGWGVSGHVQRSMQSVQPGDGSVHTEGLRCL
jgi:hypothetical protein